MDKMSLDFTEKKETSHDQVIDQLVNYLLPRTGPFEGHLRNLIENYETLKIVDYEISYTDQHGASVSELIAVRQLLALFQKNEDLELGYDKEALAYEKFTSSESACNQTNGIFLAHSRGNFHFSPRDTTVLYAARRKIAQVLGRVPAISQLRLRFGPGSTTGTRKISACPPVKMAEGFTCSNRLANSGLLPSLLRELPHWSAALDSKWSIDEQDFLVETVDVRVVPGRLEFVPKNAKTYRSIGVEPNLNMFLQLGIGDHLKKRLKLYGIDLSKQEPNQALARIGSLTGEYATLDLSSASDTISCELVRFMLPEEWFFLLDSARCDQYEYAGHIQFLEKFSSMGNGFTFPLESLIFWALTWAVCGTSHISVYGDDIICPSNKANDVIHILEVAGFTLNRKKSFVEGPFRESCGADYYLGIDIRPCYVRENISYQSLFILHNFFYRNLERELCELLVSFIPQHLRLYGPDGYGDGHLLGDWEPVHLKTRKLRDKGYDGVCFETLGFEPNRWVSIYPCDSVSPLYQIYSGSEWDSGFPLEPTPPFIRFKENGEPEWPTRDPSIRFGKNGRPEWPTPGRGKVRRITIYTFVRP